MITKDLSNKCTEKVFIWLYREYSRDTATLGRVTDYVALLVFIFASTAFFGNPSVKAQGGVRPSCFAPGGTVFDPLKLQKEIVRMTTLAIIKTSARCRRECW